MQAVCMPLLKQTKKQTPKKKKLRKQQPQHHKKTYKTPQWILLKYLMSYVCNDYFLKKPNKTTPH